MNPRLIPLLSLLIVVLLLIVAEPAWADGGHGQTPETPIDGYTVTFIGPEAGARTGRNQVAVKLVDALGRPVADARVTATLLAYLPGEAGHGETHGTSAPVAAPAVVPAVPGMAPMTGMVPATAAHAEAAATTHGDEATAAHAEAAADTHGHEATAAHAEAAATHGDETVDDHGVDGQGLAVAPVVLGAGAEPGVYRGDLSFDQPGTYTIGVVFTLNGNERGTTYELAVAQGRPRGLVLGGFALVNGLAIGAAAFLKWRRPAKPAGKPARPTPVVTPSAEEQSQ